MKVLKRVAFRLKKIIHFTNNCELNTYCCTEMKNTNFFMEDVTRLMEINFFVGCKLRDNNLSKDKVPVSRIFSEPAYSLKTDMENFY